MDELERILGDFKCKGEDSVIDGSYHYCKHKNTSEECIFGEHEDYYRNLIKCRYFEFEDLIEQMNKKNLPYVKDLVYV